MGFFKSLGKSLKSVAKVVAAPFTLGASLAGGSLKDIAKGTIKNLVSLAPIGIGAYLGGIGGASTGALGEQWNPAVSPPAGKPSSSGSGLLSGIGNLLGSSGIGLGSIVQGAIGLGTDYLTQQQQLANQMKINDKTFEQNQLLQQQAYNQNLTMWRAQNEYNSPAQQMQRLEQAGLNKNLVYGGGNVTGNTSSSAPEYSPVFHEAPKVSKLRNVIDTIMSYQQIQNQALQNDFTRARIELAAAASERADRALAMEDRFNSERLRIMRQQAGYAGERLNQPKSIIGKYVSDVKDILTDVGDYMTDKAGTHNLGNPFPGYRSNSTFGGMNR